MSKVVKRLDQITRDDLILGDIELYLEHGNAGLARGVTIEKTVLLLKDEHATLLDPAHPDAGPMNVFKARRVAELIRMAEQAIKTRAATLTPETTP